MHKILLVDDDLKNLKATKNFFETHGYDVATANSASHALEQISLKEFALVLSDFQMPDMLGDELVSEITKLNPNQQVVMYSCDLTRNAMKSSLQSGAKDFIEKTMAPADLLKVVEGFCNRYEEVFRTIRNTDKKDAARLEIESIGMVGQSEKMVQVSQIVKKLAASPDASVLIRGESGTGKELVARALHNLSSRRSFPFIAINCGAIPKDLLESELFGHVKGAFTGASDNKDGKFKNANGGTIFLDEIGDMPMDLQVKLLRVLQERTIEPLGGKISHKIDVRIISATHRDLDKLERENKFREDLIYRLRVVEVALPALRERPEDIEPLIEHFTDKYNRKNKTRKYFQRKTLDILKRYQWPGNIRELESTVERNLILCSESIVRPENLASKFFEKISSVISRITLDEFRKNHHQEFLGFLENTIEIAEGNKAEAARRLGIKSNHLNELLKDTRNRVEAFTEV